ncbi:uncharacterized protein LOC125435104 [Sphaerodactylus townsendi]|uniref:uncharacterized protein LOC125435104 n=1 Tax=Sphaerodactylus townsendi TaxID=933632 RepID=UPI00202749E5|nr:uncharacterized protein LOC125435104 [Sphaerodactylus townsendi]
MMPRFRRHYLLLGSEGFSTRWRRELSQHFRRQIDPKGLCFPAEQTAADEPVGAQGIRREGELAEGRAPEWNAAAPPPSSELRRHVSLRLLLHSATGFVDPGPNWRVFSAVPSSFSSAGSLQGICFHLLWPEAEVEVGKSGFRRLTVSFGPLETRMGPKDTLQAVGKNTRLEEDGCQRKTQAAGFCQLPRGKGKGRFLEALPSLGILLFPLARRNCACRQESSRQSQAPVSWACSFAKAAAGAAM